MRYHIDITRWISGYAASFEAQFTPIRGARRDLEVNVTGGCRCLDGGTECRFPWGDRQVEKDVSAKAWDKSKEVSAETWDKTKEVSADTWDKTKDVSAKTWDKTREVGKDAWDTTREKTTELVEKVNANAENTPPAEPTPPSE